VDREQQLANPQSRAVAFNPAMWSTQPWRRERDAAIDLGLEILGRTSAGPGLPPG
jgi:hypothetical protein